MDFPGALDLTMIASHRLEELLCPRHGDLSILNQYGHDLICFVIGGTCQDRNIGRVKFHVAFLDALRHER